MHNKFKEVLGIDIVELVDRISPLGFKFSFSKSGKEDQIIPRDYDDKRSKELEQAVEEDEATQDKEQAEEEV